MLAIKGELIDLEFILIDIMLRKLLQPRLLKSASSEMISGGSAFVPRIALFSLLFGCVFLPVRAQNTEKPAQNPGEIPLATINVIQRAKGIYLYTYKETMDPIDPYKDYETKRRITDPQIIERLKKILADNADYKQQYTARCLPVWEYGLEFRGSEGDHRTFLFSFRCNTLKLVEERVWRDFTPQKTELYSLLRYEINDQTSVQLSTFLANDI